MSAKRLTITVDDKQAAKLLRLAERSRSDPDAIASALLSRALDETDPDSFGVVELLEAIPGAYERAQLGLRQARIGKTIALGDL